MSKTKQNYKSLFLIDKVAEIDLFDHQDYADVLSKIVFETTQSGDSTLKTPFNIGVFGKWGVGKSSVVNLFRNKINELNKEKGKKFVFIDFKVWKFSHNALRKKFIFTIGKHLNNGKDLANINLRVRAKKTLVSPVISNPELFVSNLCNIKRNFSKSLFFKSFVVSVIVLLVIWIATGYPKWLKQISDIWSIISIFVFSQILTFLEYFFRALRETKMTLSFEAYDSEEQFEDEFVRLVERDKRIKIIFIDDLDRCPEDKVIETLETIKTYLDVRTCIFLIACDDDVILSIVEKKREELLKNSDSNDYLNKFFQYTLKIPPFIHQNMQAYALDLLRVQGSSLNNLEDIKDIMYVLIHNNVKDPRKVITLLNAFASDYQAVCNRENKDSGKLEVGEITNNLPTLAVFSVLKTEYPYFYDLLIRDSHFLEYILKVHDEEYNLIEPHHMDILKLIYNVPDNYQNLEDRSLWFSSYVIGKKQRQFVDYVIKVESYIKDLKDIGLYLYLDKHQSQFALSGELERQLRDDLSIASLKAVRESYSKLKTDESRKNFFNVAIECIRNFGYSHEKVNGLSVLFSIVENAPPEDIFLQIISKQIMDLLNHLEEKAKWWGHFNLNGVFFVLKHLGSVDKKDEFIKKIVSVLNNTFDIHVDFARRVLVSLFKYSHLIKKKSEVIDILKRRPVADNTASKDATTPEFVSFSLLDITSLIDKASDQAIIDFFVGDITKEIAEVLIKLDTEPEDADEKQLYENCLKTYYKIVEILNSKKRFNDSIDMLLVFIPTQELYFDAFNKINELKSDMHVDKVDSVLLVLCSEVSSVEGEALSELLELIDFLSNRISSRPISALDLLKDSLPNVVYKSIQNFNSVSDFVTKVFDGRISQANVVVFINNLIKSISISKYPDVTRNVCDFLINNKRFFGGAVRDIVF